MEKLVVLGGSSPFTVALIDALRDVRPAVDPMLLVLHGRHRENRRRVANYALHALGPLDWSVEHDERLERVLEGATIVLHQIRYGGMAGRGRDEALALRFAIAPDETLGPAALQRMLAMREPLKRLSALLRRHASHAWVLNLTNPLSAATSMLVAGGVRNCLGLCELPRATAAGAARFLGVALDDVSWSYAGLNHRGFVVRLECGGRDGIAEIASRTERRLGTFDASLIEELGAIPTKYFRLLSGGMPRQRGRALLLETLRGEIAGELGRRPDRSPQALSLRELPWYEESVVPLIRALTRRRAEKHVVNQVGSDGMTREVHARVSRGHVRALPAVEVAPGAQGWIERYESHERALVELCREPSLERVRLALNRDPLVPEESVGALARAVWDARQTEANEIGARP